MRRLLRIVLAFIFGSFVIQGHAQQSFTFYNMQSVEQSNSLNPSRKPDNRLNIGLPGLSNTFVNFSHSGFTLSEAFVKDGDSLVLDIDGMVRQMKEKNVLSLTAQTDLFSIGARIGEKNYYSFNITAKASNNIAYDKGVFELLAEGNGPFIGKNVNVNVAVNSSAYLEYGLGFARTIDSKLTLGGRVKLLSGLANISTKKNDINLYTDTVNYALELSSDLEIFTSGIESQRDEDDMIGLIFGPNKGMALDLGATYKFSDELEFSGSILDIGYINWNENVTNYKTKNPGSKVRFEGIEFNDFFNDSTDFEESLEELSDSIREQFDFAESHGSYSNSLPMQIYLGANFYINENTNIGFLMYSQYFKKKLNPGFAFSFNKKFSKYLGVYGSYSYFNKNAANIGVGFSANLGPVQLYAVTDNVLAAVDYTNANNVNLRFAMNLRFGHNSLSKDEKKQKRINRKHAKKTGNETF